MHSDLHFSGLSNPTQATHRREWARPGSPTAYIKVEPMLSLGLIPMRQCLGADEWRSADIRVNEEA
jgi:hypothetical protein